MNDIYKHFDDGQKNKEIAIRYIGMLNETPIVDCPTMDYKSSLSLSKLIVRFDNNKVVQSIEVYGNFVRLTRNQKGTFAFPAVVIDHFSRLLQINGG